MARAFRRLFLLSLFLTFVVRGMSPVPASALFQVSQAVSAYPSLEVYLDVTDATGAAVVPPPAGELMAVTGGRELSVRSLRSFAATGQGVGYVFLVDISRSLGEGELSGMRKAISSWVTSCGDRDRFALVTFGSEVHVLQDFTSGKEEFLAGVAELHPTDMLTSLHGALLEAQRLGRRQDPDLPARRVVIVLSDGKNESFYGETAREVLRELREASAPIFALGYYHPPFTEKEEHLQRLARFARASGGAYFHPEEGNLGAVFERLRARVNNTWVADLDVSGLSPEGGNLAVEVSFPGGGRSVSDVFSVRIMPPALKPVAEDPEAEDVISGAPPEERVARIDEETSPVPVAEAGQVEVSGNTEEQPPSSEGMFPAPLLLAGVVLLLFGLIVFRALRGRDGSGRVAPGAGEGVPSLPAAGPHGDPPPEAVVIPLRLEVFRGARVVRSFRFSLVGSRGIGRSAENDISIAGDRAISNRHCELAFKDGNLEVRDLGSTNGTFVNNLRIEGRSPVEDGDMLRIGQTSVRIIFETDREEKGRDS